MEIFTDLGYFNLFATLVETLSLPVVLGLRVPHPPRLAVPGKILSPSVVLGLRVSQRLDQRLAYPLCPEPHE